MMLPAGSWLARPTVPWRAGDRSVSNKPLKLSARVSVECNRR